MPKAVICRELGPPESLRLETFSPTPLAQGQVRVAVHAAGINFPDILMAAGEYQLKPPLPFTPGVEAAGEVIEVAGDRAGVAVGDKVIVKLRHGGYADEVVVTPSQLMPLPSTFDYAEGATFLAAHGTAYHALIDRGQLQPREVLLVHGAGGGVHQQHFAWLKLTAVDQRVIRGAMGGEKRCAFGVVEGRWQGHELRRRHHDFIGVSAVPQFYNDLVADRDAGAITGDLDHLAGGFHAGRERQRRLELIFACRHQDVGKVDPGGVNGDAHLPLRQRHGGKGFQTQTFGWAEFAADHGLRHQAALAFRRCSASRISGIRSLPKYMSALSMKMVGEPNPPRAITSSVLALSWSLIACSPIPSKNFCGSTPTRWQTSASTESCEMSLSSPQ